MSLIPAFLTMNFFLSSKLILLDDHEIYRLSFHEINFFTAVADDWINLFRFRPFYWFLRQLESIFFGINPFFWYGFSWCLFALSLFSLYAFFKRMGLKKYLAVMFAWISVLGYQSMGAWMALGIQEGLALTLISISLFYVSKYQINSTKKPLFTSFVFFLLAFLTKETFAFLFPFFIAILLIKYKKLCKLFYKDCLIYVSGFFSLAPIILIQSWRSHSARSSIFGLEEVTLFKTDNLVLFASYITNDKHIVLSLLFFIILFLLNILSNRSKNHSVILVGFLSLLGIIFQVIIYSFTEYIAPHYIQPFSLAVILSLSLIFLFSNFKQQLFTVIFIFLTIPMAFLRTMEYANGHNYHSRLIHEVEQKINVPSVKSIVLIGDRSHNHEQIYSMFKRIYWLYPEKNVYFYHHREPGEPGIFDVADEVEEINYQAINNADFLVSFNSNFNKPNNFRVYEFISKPAISQIDYSSTWYANAPEAYYK